jgi:hypothetical protein
MTFADVSAGAYFLSPLLCVASGVTVMGFVTALVLSFSRRTRGTAKQVLRPVIYSLLVEVGLLLFWLGLDAR